jgi:hypothetical protein
MEDTYYRVPSWELPTLTERIKKLNKRAAKLGCTPVRIKLIAHEDVERKDRGTGEKYYIRVHHVQVEGDAPKIAGWSLVACLQGLSEEGNLSRVVPGETLPREYRHADASKCEHCNTDRPRKYAYVVRNEEGEYKQVGRSCLKDFLGHTDPKAIASWAETLWKLDAEIRGYGEYDDEEPPESDGRPRYALIDIKEYLAWVAHCIDNFGWVSKTEAYESGYCSQATAVQATDLMFTKSSYIREVIEKIGGPPGKKQYEEAEAAIAWTREIDPETDSDYLFNLRVACSNPWFESRDTGLVASLITVHRRELDRARERKAQEEARTTEADSKHFGVVGARADYTLKLISVRSFDGRYGTTYLHKFYDHDGNVVTWWASKNGLDVDKWYTVRGTVKKHDEYRGIKQTVLTRCACDELPN